MNHFMMNRVAAAALLFGLLVAATVRCDDGWPDIEGRCLQAGWKFFTFNAMFSCVFDGVQLKNGMQVPSTSRRSLPLELAAQRRPLSD